MTTSELVNKSKYSIGDNQQVAVLHLNQENKLNIHALFDLYSKNYTNKNILNNRNLESENDMMNQFKVSRFMLNRCDSLSSNISKDSLEGYSFEHQFLDRHNYYRRAHGVPDLQISPNLTCYAKDWVEIIARNDRLERRYTNRHGENVFVIQSDESDEQFNGAIPVDYWYETGASYDYHCKYPKEYTAPFSQLIWKGTKFVGLAWAKSKSNKIYVVASYSPSGNFTGQYLNNVYPLLIY